MKKLYPPYTIEQVARLKEWQSGVMWIVDFQGITMPNPTHPFTCNGEDRAKCPDMGILIPSEDGWNCPCGRYYQNWSWEFMANDPAPSELNKLFKRVLALAKVKEYPFINDLLNPSPYEFWRMDGLRYVNVVCGLLSEWLRSDHSILVWVEPIGKPEGIFLYTSFCDLSSQSMGLATVPIMNDEQSSFEYVWLAGIEHALKSLPPASSTV